METRDFKTNPKELILVYFEDIFKRLFLFFTLTLQPYMKTLLDVLCIVLSEVKLIILFIFIIIFFFALPENEPSVI